MKLVNFLNHSVIYYDNQKADGFAIEVSENFWNHLSTDGIQYRSGGMRNRNLYSEELVLKLTDPEFDKIFLLIANSEIGKQVLVGDLPPNTVM
jgi:hypothetical protein